jgi:hypothetical protein
MNTLKDDRNCEPTPETELIEIAVNLISLQVFEDRNNLQFEKFLKKSGMREQTALNKLQEIINEI